MIKSISIPNEMNEWIKNKYINLSRFVQKKIKEEMKNDINKEKETL